jgi:pilus assembly protein FimV
MAFNKAKAMESALKALNQGKVAQAIQEYQQILRSDPNDQVVLMTVGDLFVRQGNMPQAVEYFERLADRYLHDGFNSKAIAIYKKISKLAPAETQPLEKLANLYVQQGVLSEARPIFLQLAEAHLKANQTPKAVEVLRKLLEVEPDNPRVQRRLGELYMAIGQKKEAVQTYLNFARYLNEHGDVAEAIKMADAALEIEPGNGTALLLKAKTQGAAGDVNAALQTLAKLPDADSNPETQSLQVDLALKAGKSDRAVELARHPDSQGRIRFPVVFRLSSTLLEAGEADLALDLIGGVREAALAAGEQERLVQALTSISERLKGRPEPFEWLADIYRRAGDTYHLSEAQSQLADILTTAGQVDRAEAILKELLEHEPDNELARQRLAQLRKEMGQASAAPASPGEHLAEAPAVEVSAGSSASPAVSAFDAGLDEDTQRFVAQALTDVDLLSSYGLTQKAIQLLETILQRVPGHGPSLERLLDISLGSGDDRQTAELAAQLEQIYAQRGDAVNAERFTELRRRFQRASGASEEEIARQPEIAARPVAPPAVVPPSHAQEPAEFTVPVAPSEPQAPETKPEPAVVASSPGIAEQEIDLSDEWEKITAEAAPEAPAATEPVPAAEAEPVEATVPGEPEPGSLEAELADFDLELVSETPGTESEAMTSQSFLDQLVAEVEGMEAPTAGKEASPKEGKGEEAKPAAKSQAQKQPVAASEISVPVPEPEPAPAPPPAAPPSPARVEAQPKAAPAAKPKPAPPVVPAEPAPLVAPPTPPVPEPAIAAEAQTPAPVAAASGATNDLSEVFQEFRAELGEMGEEDEDLETHYNLGIAYREMGLLDEAIGEFQKVAKSVQAGRPFRYAMQCSTLLGVTFMDKQEPKIAAMWYERALGTPGLDQETVLALRYDLGVAEEQAGNAKAALDIFRQVYAMNIDYRDVAERISVLQKH